MQIPLRASGSSEIFPGTPRRPDETQSHYWPYGQRGKLLTEAVGKKGEKKSKRQIEEAYLQPGHTHLTHRERVNCNLPSKKDGSGSQTGVHLKDEWERKRGGIDGKESVNVCFWKTVVNCEHC